MLPVLVNLPFLKIYTFGVFLLLAFFWGSFMLWKNVLLTAYKEEDIFDSMFLSLIFGLLVSRIVYVGSHFGEFGLHPLRWLLINGYPGLSLYGYILGVLMVLYLYFQYKKIKFREAIDYFIPAAFIALGFGKIGAFFSGSEVGTKTNLMFSMKYVGADGLRHLTPLYEGLLFFVGAFIAYKMVFAVRRNTYPKGAVVSFFFWYLSLVLLWFDFIKDRRTLIVSSVSLNQAVSAILLLTFTIIFLYYFRSSFISNVFKHGKSSGKSNTKKVS